MRCPQCGSDNPINKRFCGDCGAPLLLRCPRCNSENFPGKKFCGDCGYTLGPDPQSKIAQSDTITALELTDGERKIVTALFADLKGSTTLMERLDPERRGRLLIRHCAS